MLFTGQESCNDQQNLFRYSVRRETGIHSELIFLNKAPAKVSKNSGRIPKLTFVGGRTGPTSVRAPPVGIETPREERRHKAAKPQAAGNRQKGQWRRLNSS